MRCNGFAVQPDAPVALDLGPGVVPTPGFWVYLPLREESVFDRFFVSSHPTKVQITKDRTSMRLVPSAVVRPHHCAVYPHLGSNQREGYFDTGTQMNAIDPHVYVSVVAVKEMAAQLGYVPPEDHGAKCVEVEELKLALDHLLAESAEAARKLEAIDVIESAGFRARKKAGRKPQQSKTEEPVAA